MGALPLALFNQVQEPLLLSELVKLEQSAGVAEAAGLACLDERRADLLITLAQLRRILVNSLYFLEVKADGNTFYKIGITTRDLEERIAPGAEGCESALLGCGCQFAGTRGNIGGMSSCTSNTGTKRLITALAR